MCVSMLCCAYVYGHYECEDVCECMCTCKQKNETKKKRPIFCSQLTQVSSRSCTPNPQSLSLPYSSS
jgi:hypothetical protein